MDKYMNKKDVVSYIRKEAAEAQSAFEELGGESGIIAEAFEDLANELEDFPAADVAPVVRCKDCRYAKPVIRKDEKIEDVFRCVYLKPNTYMFDIDYCRYGKRKDGAE